jgi:hypothetical protein
MAARKPQKGLDKFQYALVASGRPKMTALFRSKKKAKLLLDEIHKEIFELGPPTPPGKPTGRSRYRQWLMHHFSEILRALDTMKDVEFYIGRFPYRKATIVKHRHVQFHVEAFLHEIYILRGRLAQFLAFIERSHRSDPRLPEIKDACGVLNSFVVESMKKGVAIRGSHVHRWRLSDTKIERLHAISFYTLGPKSKLTRVFKTFYEAEYRKTRKLWRGWIAEGIAEAQTIVDAYFDGAGTAKTGGSRKCLKGMVRPERFELPTFWFVARRSIQLS